MPVRGRRSCTRVGEWACGSRAIGEWGGRAGTRVPARRRVGCPTRGEWAVPLAASGRVTRRRVGEWGGREGRGVLLAPSRTARVDFMFSDAASKGVPSTTTPALQSSWKQLRRGLSLYSLTSARCAEGCTTAYKDSIVLRSLSLRTVAITLFPKEPNIGQKTVTLYPLL